MQLICCANVQLQLFDMIWLLMPHADVCLWTVPDNSQSQFSYKNGINKFNDKKKLNSITTFSQHFVSMFTFERFWCDIKSPNDSLRIHTVLHATQQLTEICSCSKILRGGQSVIIQELKTSKLLHYERSNHYRSTARCSQLKLFKQVTFFL